ncbi:MAG: secretin N-terminal domain-containing protein [Anaerolineae bacterium]
MVSFNFEEADLVVVLRALADIAGINFVLGQGVKVKVTMRIDGLPATEALAIMQAILEVNNLATVKVGTIYKILPAAAAQRQPAPIGVGRDLVAEEGFFTQLVPLQHLSAEGMIKIFQPLISQGKVLAHPETNTLILSGPAPVIKEIVDTLKALDVPGRKRDVPQIYVYYVENAKASELASILETMFAERVEPTEPTRFAFLGPEPPSPPPVPPRPGVAAPAPGEAPPPIPPGALGEARIIGDVRIVPDERMNALVIKATPRDYEAIEDTIKKLDLTPKQVIIETLVAEVALTDSFSLGVEWFIRAGMFTFQQVFGLGPAAGFTMTFVDSDEVRVFLNTISSYTEIDILTSPHLLTRDNKAARIQIGQEVPIVTGTQSTVTAVSGGGEGVFQTIQQKEIGRILSVTPHVNEQRQVTLEISLEVSDVLPESTVSGTPSFSMRTIETSVVVEDGQSLLIGGIIDKGTTHEKAGIPVLRDLPVIGPLFGTTVETETRSELLIMLTPHVIATPEEGSALTEKFKKRLDRLEEQLQEFSPADKEKQEPEIARPIENESLGIEDE